MAAIGHGSRVAIVLVVVLVVGRCGGRERGRGRFSKESENEEATRRYQGMAAASLAHGGLSACLRLTGPGPERAGRVRRPFQAAQGRDHGLHPYANHAGGAAGHKDRHHHDDQGDLRLFAEFQRAGRGWAEGRAQLQLRQRRERERAQGQRPAQGRHLQPRGQAGRQEQDRESEGGRLRGDHHGYGRASHQGRRRAPADQAARLRRAQRARRDVRLCQQGAVDRWRQDVALPDCLVRRPGRQRQTVGLRGRVGRADRQRGWTRQGWAVLVHTGLLYRTQVGARAFDMELTRRDFLRTASVGTLGAGAWMARLPAQPIPGFQVQRRQLGKTGLMVSELAFGGHSFRAQGGSPEPSPEEAVKIVAKVIEYGVNLFDTTDQKERQALAKCFAEVGAKGQCHVVARHDWGGGREALMRSAELSLRQLHVDALDVFLAGIWSPAHFNQDTLAAFDELKKSGKVRFVGLGGHFSPENGLRTIEQNAAHLDAVCVPYNFSARAAERVMDAAEKHRLGVLTKKPFNRGALLPATHTPKRPAAHTPFSLPRAFLKFVLVNDKVDAALVGMNTVAQAEEDLRASGEKLTPPELDALSRATAVASATRAYAPEWLEAWRA
ncbi:MAG: aldo/keto reductase [Planctomycetes bacterium]|nr:aldo/keto reductase [Planctomycetota bacterium]